MTSLQMPTLFTILDDQTQRFWTWLFLKEKIQLQPPLLLSVKDLQRAKDFVVGQMNEQTSKGTTTLDGILTRCLCQLDILLTWSENPDRLDRLRHEAVNRPDVGQFDDTLKTVLRHKWYDYSLIELSSFGDELKAFLIVQGTLPAIPNDTYDFRLKCWECRFSQAVSFDDQDDDGGGVDDENEKRQGCDHLIFFLRENVQGGSGDLNALHDDEEEERDVRRHQVVERLDWHLEIRRKERLRKTRQMVLLQIEREKMEHQRLMERIRCPKQINLSCFDAFREFERRLETSFRISSHLRGENYVVFDENDVVDFRARLKSIICWDCNTQVLYEKALDKWCHLHLNMNRKERVSSEATLRGVMAAEGEDALRIQDHLDFLKSRPLLGILDDEHNRNASPSIDLFDSLLYLACIETFLDVRFHLVSEDRFDPDESHDVIVLFHRSPEELHPFESKRGADAHRSRCLAEHLRYGARRGGGTVTLFDDIVSLSLFWLRTIRNAYSNDTLAFVVGAAAR